MIHNEYGSGAGYALGAATVVTTTDSKNGAYQYATTTTNSFDWWDGAVQSTVSFARTGATTSNSTYNYGGSGQLASISVVDGVRNRNITFTTDMLGQVIRRDEADGNYSGTYSGDPHEIWYRYNGRQIAYTGNNGTYDTDYAASIAARAKAPVGSYAFRHGDWNGPTATDYDPSLEHINSYSQGSAGGGYTVRAGDTLAGIAQALWGDASLWYKLAEANGLSGAAGLIEGRSLIVPHGVQANHHNASTLKPYDPAEMIGNTSPSAPKPQKKGGKCGVFGQILLVAIAVAVTVLSHGALAGTFGTIIGGALSGAAGSIVSQGFGVATGIQDKFSFKQVAFAAIGGAVGGAMRGVDFVGNLGKFTNLANDIARGALSNVAIQGVGVAVGLQKKFDFAAVAVAGVVSGVSGAAGRGLGARSLDTNTSLANHARIGAAGAAAAIAGAASRSLLTGTDFGDNLIAVLPDVIGSTIGNAFGYGVSRGAGHSARPPSNVGDFPTTRGIQLASNGPLSDLRAYIGEKWDSAVQTVSDAPSVLVQWGRDRYRQIVEGGYDTPDIVVNGVRWATDTFDSLSRRISTSFDGQLGRVMIRSVGTMAFGQVGGQMLERSVSGRNASALGRGARVRFIELAKDGFNIVYNLSGPGFANAMLENLGVRTVGPNANRVFVPVASAAEAGSRYVISRLTSPSLLATDARSLTANVQARVTAFNRMDSLSQQEAMFEFAGGRAVDVAAIVLVPGPKVRLGTSGARQLAHYDFEGAEIAYGAIRNMDDLGAIAGNIGKPEFQVRRVKNHVFVNEHLLDDGVRRFDADPEIANAWGRMQSGSHTPQDMMLFGHELLEAKFEGIFRSDYRTAHQAAIRSGRPGL